MNRKKINVKIIFILLTALSICGVSGNSMEYTLGGLGRVTYQIYSISALFYEQIESTDKLKLHIEDEEGNSIIESSKCNIMSYPEYDNATLTIYFEPVLWLPKGKSYKAVLEAGSVKGLTSGTYNEQGVVEFYVPQYLDQHCSIADGEILSEIETIKLTYSTEAIYGSEYSHLTGMKPVCKIYKDDVLVGKKDIEVLADLSVSWGYLNFKKPFKLAKNSEYTFIIPERSVFSVSRPDIYNQELKISVTGLYEGECNNLNFIGYNLSGNSEVELIFDREFQYNPESCCFVMSTKKTPGVINILEPTIEKKGDKWVAKLKQYGDFYKTNMIYIPAGTFIAPDGEVYANQDLKIYLSEDSSGVEEVTSSVAPQRGMIFQYGDYLVIKGFEDGIITIYDTSGIERKHVEISGDTELSTAEFPKGVLIYRFDSPTGERTVSGRILVD